MYVRVFNNAIPVKQIKKVARWIPFFSIWVFSHDHSRIPGLEGKGEGISLTPHYHFHPLNSKLFYKASENAELQTSSGAVVLWLSLLHNFIQQGLNSGWNWNWNWNALFHVEKIVEKKKNQINEWIIQVLAHINRYV